MPENTDTIQELEQRLAQAKADQAQAERERRQRISDEQARFDLDLIDRYPALDQQMQETDDALRADQDAMASVEDLIGYVAKQVQRIENTETRNGIRSAVGGAIMRQRLQQERPDPVSTRVVDGIVDQFIAAVASAARERGTVKAKTIVGAPNQVT